MNETAQPAAPSDWVLIVDDEPVIREVLEKLLAQPGRALLAVASAAEALQAANARPYCAALIDKNLIGTSGLDLARELRRRHPDLEVILMSGYASLESALEAVQIGAFDYVRKPIDDYDSLSLRLQNAVEKSKMRRRQRELMQELLESELRYRTLFEATPDALLVRDLATGKFIDANPGAVALYGYSSSELAGLSPEALIAQPDVTPQRHLTRAGALFFAEVTSTRFELGDQRLETLSVRDVSERARAEEQQRGLELRLRQAQKLDAIGRLASGIAHHFNHVLAVVLAHTAFLRDGVPSDHPAADEVEGIYNAATRGAALTTQLLMFGRKKNLETQTVSWNPVVADVLKLLKRLLGAQVAVAIDLQQDLWCVSADPDELTQVLLNFAINARDAMPAGGTISVQTTNLALAEPRSLPGGELAAGRHVRLSVRDTGTGMTPEVLARLFEPFFTTKAMGKGTGLGLATVYGIIRAAGGVLSVETTEGVGSTFTVYLPAQDESAREVRKPAPARGVARGETILVVEDDERLRLLLRRILERAGYQVLDAGHGAGAHEAARAHQGELQLLLADVMLPDTDGFALSAELRALRPGLRALHITGYRDAASPDERVALLQKPFSTPQLLGAIRALLDVSSGGA